MTIQAQLPSFSPPAAMPSLLETLGLKSGQSVAATVLGTTANGQTQLEIGGQVLSVQLPQPMATGTVLQLRADGNGQSLQLTLTVQTPLAALPQAPLPAMPQPVLVQLLPEDVSQAPVSALPQAPVIASPQAPAVALPQPAMLPQTPDLAPPPPSTPAVLQSSAVLSLLSPETPAEPLAPAPVPASPQPTMQQATTVLLASPETAAEPLPSASAPVSPQPASASGPQQSPAAPAATAQPPSATPPPQAPTQPAAQALPAAPTQSVAAGAEPQAPPPAMPASTSAASAPAALPAVAPSGQLPVATPLPVVIQATGQPAQLLIVGRIVADVAPAPSLAPVPTPTTSPAPSAATPQQLSPGTVLTVTVPGSNQTGQLLILDQGRPADATLASQPSPPASAGPEAPATPAQPTPGTVLKVEVQVAGRAQVLDVTVVSADPVAKQAGPTAAPRPLPVAMPQQTPAAPKSSAPALSPLLAQTARADVAQQDSTAPLIARLLTLPDAAAQLPRPVLQAAQAVLATPIDLEAGPPSGDMLKRATLRSGVFFENALQGGTPVTPQQGDVKASLLQLRSAIMAWLGPEAAVPPVQPNRRPAPPLRGAPPRSETTDLRAPADASPPKDVARQLLNQTDAAISRVRLFQLASLPDAAPAAARANAPAEWNVELPLLLGRELCMAQFQVSRDGKSQRPDQKRGWQMRFSMNFSALGQVGAQISLNGSAANVMLWADRPETSEAINQMLPELAPALAAKGLSPEGIFCRTGSPRQPMRPVGKFVDSLS
ncbi:MAG TPA: flagellar hook-length control protein FliK [Arsenicitalea sp.]|jgi:hypothetical protein|nr:flagellar hook-length control protein FliK [Arsenicitalea sp.]